MFVLDRQQQAVQQAAQKMRQCIDAVAHRWHQSTRSPASAFHEASAHLLGQVQDLHWKQCEQPKAEHL